MTPKKAIEIVYATSFEGDIRVNMTTVISAGRTLARRVQKLEFILKEIREHQQVSGASMGQKGAVWYIANKAICDGAVAGESP